MLKIEKLQKTIKGKQILTDINLQVKEGEVLSLFGPSGCGKSTLLRCIAGLETAEEGLIFLHDQEISSLSAAKRPVVMMFQDPLLFPHLTVIENIEFGLKQAGVKRAERFKQAKEMLKKVEMEEYYNRFPHQLSGGQKQRIALARALILNPKLLLLDEPFSSLDGKLRYSMRIWVAERLREFNVTAVFVTHDKDEAKLMGDSIAIMHEGKIEQSGDPEEVYNMPATKVVADLFSEGIMIEDKFIPVENLSLFQINKGSLPDGFERINTVIIQEKIKKYGRNLYRVSGPLIQDELWIISDEIFSNNDKAELYKKLT
ncbi:ABC transporter ATP-binding protein [Bacillus sp. SCS-153A]|uniref:ABC transporter ATP-binding protein n=1 Tax=Rossellomorea sedimentorum TaxID=3115294 RepID=UPI003905B561